jgi:hypothetical protein
MSKVAKTTFTSLLSLDSSMQLEYNIYIFMVNAFLVFNMHDSIALFSLKPLHIGIVAGFEPGSSVPMVYAMATAPRRQGIHNNYFT